MRAIHNFRSGLDEDNVRVALALLLTVGTGAVDAVS